MARVQGIEQVAGTVADRRSRSRGAPPDLFTDVQVCLLTLMACAQGIEQVAGTVADQAQPVAQRTAKFLKEQAPVVAENAEPTAARASEIAEGLAHEVRCLIAVPAQPACTQDTVCSRSVQG